MGCFPQTLAHALRRGGALVLTCEACGWSTAWTAQAALRRLGARTTAMEAAARLRCARCGLFRVTFS